MRDVTDHKGREEAELAVALTRLPVRKGWFVMNQEK